MRITIALLCIGALKTLASDADIITATYLQPLKITSYRSVENQTDSTPFHTSTGQRVHPHGVAVSRDLLCGACKKLHGRCSHPEYEEKIHYGDWLLIEGIGLKNVNDCLAPASIVSKTKSYRIERQLDCWVSSLEEEQKHHKKFGFNKLKVWRINNYVAQTQK